MKTNLFCCAPPGQAGQMALRYLFSNSKYDEELKEIAFGLIDSITGFDHFARELKIARIWPMPVYEVGLEVEIRYSSDLYHLSFFFFEYGFKGNIEETMESSTCYLRGDGDSKGDFFVVWRPEDKDDLLWCHGKLPLGCRKAVVANGPFLSKAISARRCGDPFFSGYLEYLSDVESGMSKDISSIDPSDHIWLMNPVGFENYVDNWLRPLMGRELGNEHIPHFHRTDHLCGELVVPVDTGFEIKDIRGEFVDSWFYLVFRIEFPRPVLVVNVKGDCMCWEDPEHWIPGDDLNEAFFRMRKTFDSEDSLFAPKGGGSEPVSLVAELKERAVSLKGRYVWSVIFPKQIIEFVTNIKQMLAKSARP